MGGVEKRTFRKPRTLRRVADESRSLSEFGANLRDWQHSVSRTTTSRPEFAARVCDPPPLLKDRFLEGSIADAYLAAYAEWLCEQAKMEAPGWVREEGRSLASPWYADRNTSQLEKLAPSSFAKRGVYTVPDAVFKPRRGRPRVPEETKRRKRIERQRAYRARIKSLVEAARALERRE